MKRNMKRTLFLLAVLIAAVFLGAAAQAEIRVNEFPAIDAIPEHFVAGEEIPPLPTYKVRSEPQGPMSRYTVTGVKAWGVDPEMMADLRYTFEKGWYSTSSNRYDDQIVFILDLKPGNGMLFPTVETEDGPVDIGLTIMKDDNSDSPSSGLIGAEFRFKADGTRVCLGTDGLLSIDRTYGDDYLSVWYDESGNLMWAREAIALPDGFNFGSYTLERVTDCLTGERFEELTVEGGLDPDATRLRIAGEELPRKIKILPPGKSAFGEGDPVLPVRDTLPADALPEVWPAEFPDGFPAFSCEEADGKYIWTVESLTAWGARPDIPGETYLVRETPDYSTYNINYYTRDRTLDDVPEDRFRIISEAQDGSFRVNVYAVENDAQITLEGEARKDSEGNPAPTLSLTLEFKYPTRYATVKYFSDGTTVQKQIATKIGGESMTGEYGEDNRLR